MRRTSVLIAVAAVFSMGSLAYSTNMTFTSSGTIEDGDVYDHVYVENDLTVVDMFSGQVGNLQTGNVSTFNLHGGQITKVVPVGTGSIIDIGRSSTFNVSGGLIDVRHLVVRGIVNISGGNLTLELVKMYPYSAMSITGGDLRIRFLSADGHLHISGGKLRIESASIPHGSVIDVYGYDFNYDPSGGPHGEGILTGFLMDGNPLTIGKLAESEYQRFNLIPEPTTFLLLGLGGLVLRKRR